MKLTEEHIEGKYLHIPIEQATVAKDGDIVYSDRYWCVIKKGYISIYIGNSKPNFCGMYRTYSPQCNASKSIVEKLGESLYLPTVFLPDKLQVGSL